MAGLSVAEYEDIADTIRGAVPVGKEPALAEYQVAINAGSTQSQAFDARTRFVRLQAGSACSVAFATDPTATVDHKRFAANQTEYLGVPPGASYKLAVISNP